MCRKCRHWNLSVFRRCRCPYIDKLSFIGVHFDSLWPINKSEMLQNVACVLSVMRRCNDESCVWRIKYLKDVAALFVVCFFVCLFGVSFVVGLETIKTRVSKVSDVSCWCGESMKTKFVWFSKTDRPFVCLLVYLFVWMLWMLWLIKRLKCLKLSNCQAFRRIQAVIAKRKTHGISLQHYLFRPQIVFRRVTRNTSPQRRHCGDLIKKAR